MYGLYKEISILIITLLINTASIVMYYTLNIKPFRQQVIVQPKPISGQLLIQINVCMHYAGMNVHIISIYYKWNS